MKQVASYGIDLGTTELLIAKLDETGSQTLLSIDQAIDEKGRRQSLSGLSAAWFLNPDGEFLIGEAARLCGSRYPAKLILSAKSWLAEIRWRGNNLLLPQSTPDLSADIRRISPTECQTLLLDAALSGIDPKDAAAIREACVITIPASFDPIAREQTLIAAKNTGINARLLEEPVAAFYHFLDNAALSLQLAQGSYHFAVLDIGGGTTDLCLIRLDIDEEGIWTGTRLAVGDHLLIGGDNIDRSITEAIFAQCPLDSLARKKQYSSVLLLARELKERLLSEDCPPTLRASLAGEGTQLFGQAMSFSLDRDSLRRDVLENFFPLIPKKHTAKKAGFRGLGLNYERNVEFSFHLQGFIQEQLPPGKKLDGVLCQGALFRSSTIVERVKEILKAAHPETEIYVGSHPREAVAFGAAIFSERYQTGNTLLGSPSAHSYFIKVIDDNSESCVCILPKGIPPLTPQNLSESRFELLLDREISFSLYATNETFLLGDRLPPNSPELSLTAMLSTQISRRSELTETPSKETLQVHLQAELNALELLEIKLVPSTLREEEIVLHFDLNSTPSESVEDKASSQIISYSEEQLQQATELIKQSFLQDEQDASRVKKLNIDLERILGQRKSWSAELNRNLADVLLQHISARKLSIHHERTFWNLTGFCLRPGYGFPGDEGRISRLLATLKERLIGADEHRNWAQFFIAWRRLAGGLSEAKQVELRRLLDPFFATPSLKRARKDFVPLAEHEMLELCCNLERVPPASKQALLDAFVKRIYQSSSENSWRFIAALGRRQMTYADSHYTIPSPALAEVTALLLKEDWQKNPQCLNAAIVLARLATDPSHDLPDSSRLPLIKKCQENSPAEEKLRPLFERIALSRSEIGEASGEELPPGLILN